MPQQQRNGFFFVAVVFVVFAFVLVMVTFQLNSQRIFTLLGSILTRSVFQLFSVFSRNFGLPETSVVLRKIPKFRENTGKI